MIPDGFTVVAGSLGDQGGAVARQLKLHGAPRAGTHAQPLVADRAPAADDGVEVLNDSLETPEVVVRDLAGAAHVFAAFTPFEEGGLQAVLRQARNLAWASVRAGGAAIRLRIGGRPGAGPRGERRDELWGVERLLRQFDLPLTLLRPAFFMENIDEFALRRDDEAAWCCACR